MKVTVPVFAIERAAGLQFVERIKASPEMLIDLDVTFSYVLIPTLETLREWVLSDNIVDQLEGTKQLRISLAKEVGPPIQEVSEEKEKRKGKRKKRGKKHT